METENKNKHIINHKIKFKDLSPWLKVSIIMGWLILAELTVSFLYGFFIGMGL